MNCRQLRLFIAEVKRGHSRSVSNMTHHGTMRVWVNWWWWWCEKVNWTSHTSQTPLTNDITNSWIIANWSANVNDINIERLRHGATKPSYLRECVTASADVTSRPRLRSTSSQRYWTAAHTSEVRWTFVLVCRTKGLEQSPVFTARTHRHQNFQTQTKDLSFSAGLSLNSCSFILSFYFYSLCFMRYVIRWSILFCKRNSLWTMNRNYELWPFTFELLVPWHSYVEFSCSFLPLSMSTYGHASIERE